MPSQTRVSASYRAMIGDRMANQFIANAGLGITGCFEPVIYTIDWKPGEVVDEARARAAGQVLKDAILADGRLDCHTVEFLCIHPTPVSSTT